MACCSRGVREMLMAGKCNRFLRVSELSVSTWIRRFSGKDDSGTRPIQN